MCLIRVDKAKTDAETTQCDVGMTAVGMVWLSVYLNLYCFILCNRSDDSDYGVLLLKNFV